MRSFNGDHRFWALAFAALILAVVSVASGPARGQAASGGEADTEQLRLYQLKGFRSARFGSAPDDIREAIRKDFDLGSAAITETRHPDQKTLLLTAVVPGRDRARPG